MPSWHDRFVSRAKSDGTLRSKLHELARLDAEMMATAGMAAQSPIWMQNAEHVNSLCDEVAQRVAEPDDDVDEAAQWISYNCQSVARSLPPPAPSFGFVFPLVLAVTISLVIHFIYPSWIVAILGAVTVVGLITWIRSLKRA